MFEKIKNLERNLENIENRDENDQLDILIGRGWKSNTNKIRNIVLEYMSKASRERNRFIR
jgi:hypothetical protein